jgi:four helix bundle protein
MEGRIMRDPNKLEAFQIADALALDVYAAVRHFPSHERFGLALQLRRAVVSIPANIVEGCARETAADYARFLSIAYGSACEVQYEIRLADRLGYLSADVAKSLAACSAQTTRLLNRLVNGVQRFRPRGR